MFRTSRYPAAFFLISLSLAACGPKGDGSPEVARYRKEILTQNELFANIPDNLSPEDSTHFAKVYIERWALEHAIAEEASAKIPGISEKVDARVEEYRRLLLRQALDNFLLEGKMSSEISEDTLRAWYEKEKKNFIAPGDLYSYLYVAAPDEGSGDVADLMRSNDPAQLQKLVNWAKTKAISYRLDSSYVSADDLEQDRKGYLGSLAGADAGQLIRWSGVIQGQKRKYFFRMLNAVDSGDPMPYPLVREDLRQMILNDRRMKHLAEEHDRILTEAKSSGNFTTP